MGERLARIVHVLDPREGGEDSVLACRAALALQRRDLEQHVWLLGGSEDEADAASAGVATTDRLSISAGPAYRAATSLGRLHAQRAAAWGLPASAVICWSPRAARLVEAEMWDVPRRVLVLTTGPGREDEARMSVVRTIAAAGAPAWQVAALGEGQRTLWNEAGVPLGTALPLPATGLVDAPAWQHDRARVRSMLNVREGEGLLMLLGDPPESADAQRMVTMGGMIFHAGTPLLCAAPRRAFQMARACRYAVTHHRAWEIVPLDDPMVRALPGADVVMWEVDEERARLLPGKPTGGSLLAGIACSMGVPVVGPDHPVCREVLAGAAGPCLARGKDHPDYAHKLLPLLHDAPLRRRAGEALAAAWGERGATAYQHAFEALAALPPLREPPLVPSTSHG